MPIDNISWDVTTQYFPNNTVKTSCFHTYIKNQRVNIKIQDSPFEPKLFLLSGYCKEIHLKGQF